MIGKQYIYGWDIQSICLNNINNLKFKNYNENSVIGNHTFFKGNFEADPNKDVLLIISKLKKGVIFINGRLLGRYNHIGPQKEYYIPRNYLLKSNNEIVVLETETFNRNRNWLYL